MKCLMLAGGFATRLHPITSNRAKALLEFRGKPVINHAIEKVPPDVDILVSTNRKFEADFRNWQQTLDRPVELCVEEALSDRQKLGAVGAIHYWVAQKPITEDLMVIAADNYFELDLGDLVTQYDGKNAIVAVYDVGDKEKACEIGRTCQLGLAVVEGDRIIRLDEKPEAATSSLIATGIYILPARVFPMLSSYCVARKADNLGSFITYLLNHEEVRAYVFRSAWIDIGDEILKGRLSV